MLDKDGEDIEVLWQHIKNKLMESRDPDAEIDRITEAWVTDIDKSGRTRGEFRERLYQLLQEARDEIRSAQRH